MTRVIEQVQWAYSALVQPGGASIELSGSPYTWSSEVFPYTVPTDRWLAICSASLASKFGGIGRASYLVVQNAFTVTDNGGQTNFGASPFIVPPGAQLRAYIFNNETMTPEYGAAGGEAQWMNMAMTGYLLDHAEGMTRRTCLNGVVLP